MRYESKLQSVTQGSTNSTMQVTSTIDYLPVAIEDSTITVEMKITNIKTDLNSEGPTLSFDTSKEPNNQTERELAKKFGAIINLTITLKMNKLGKIIEIVSPSTTDIDINTLKGFSIVFPQEAIAKGYSWDSEKEIIQLNTTYDNIYHKK